MKKLFFFSLLLISISLAIPVYAPLGGYGGVTLSAWTDTAPTIDGDMNSFPGEWSAGDYMEFQTDNSINGTIYVMNNDLYLFILLRINKTGMGTMGDLRIMFDNDNDRVEWEQNDDAIYYGYHPPPSSGFVDQHYGEGWVNDTFQHGGGVLSDDADYRYFEFYHPLNSGDMEDFSLSIGDTVGFQLTIESSCWPSTTESTNDIIIAGKPPGAVGGKILPNAPAMLYLFALLILATSLGVGFKTRKREYL